MLGDDFNTVISLIRSLFAASGIVKIQTIPFDFIIGKCQEVIVVLALESGVSISRKDYEVKLRLQIVMVDSMVIGLF